MDFIQQGVPTDATTSLVFVCVVVVGVGLWVYFSTRNILIPAVSAVLGLAAALIVFFVNQDLYIGFVGKVLEWLSLVKRFDSFPRGLLRLDAIVYYLSFSALFLFLTVRLIEKKRWG
jgi:ABC-2 type transport system permease protein